MDSCSLLVRRPVTNLLNSLHWSFGSLSNVQQSSRPHLDAHGGVVRTPSKKLVSSDPNKDAELVRMRVASDSKPGDKFRLSNYRRQCEVA
jgi:hypothetical protein